MAHDKAPYALDKQLFLFYGWRRTAQYGKTIYRESENIPKEVRKGNGVQIGTQ